MRKGWCCCRHAYADTHDSGSAGAAAVSGVLVRQPAATHCSSLTISTGLRSLPILGHHSGSGCRGGQRQVRETQVQLSRGCVLGRDDGGHKTEL